MRPLRHLPATVSDVQGPGRGDGLAARPDLPDAGRRRGTHRADRDLRPSPRPLSRLPSVRERVSLRRPLRLAPRGDTRPAPAPRSATPAAPPRALHLFGVPRARARRRSARAPAPLSAVGAPAAGAIDGRAAALPAAPGDGGLARRRATRRAAPRAGPGARATAWPRRTPDRVRAGPPLPGRQPRHGALDARVEAALHAQIGRAHV